MFRLVNCALLAVAVLAGCDKDKTEEDTFPVWILNVTVRDGEFPSREVQNCAHVLWSYSGGTTTQDAPCRNSNGFVKVWDHVDADVRIFYRVECEGYQPSSETFADFFYSIIDTMENRDGAEVIQNVTVTIFPG